MVADKALSSLFHLGLSDRCYALFHCYAGPSFSVIRPVWLCEPLHWKVGEYNAN